MMNNKAYISLPLDEGWRTEVNVYDDEGYSITHFNAYYPDRKSKVDRGVIDVYVGLMPEGSSARNEVLVSYSEVVGFTDEDKDETAIACLFFQGREAYGYEFLSDDGFLNRLLACEIDGGRLLMVTVAVPESEMDAVYAHVEDNLEVK